MKAIVQLAITVPVDVPKTWTEDQIFDAIGIEWKFKPLKDQLKLTGHSLLADAKVYHYPHDKEG